MTDVITCTKCGRKTSFWDHIWFCLECDPAKCTCPKGLVIKEPHIHSKQPIRKEEDYW